MTSRMLNGIPVFDRQIIAWFIEGLNEAIDGDTGIVYTKLANIRKLENPNDAIATYTGGGYYGLHGEWEPARLFEPGQGWRITFLPYLFKNAFRVPGTLTEFQGSMKLVETLSRQLGGYGVQTIDQLFVNMLNNGFNASFPTYDGQPLFSLSHPLRNSAGTFANRPAAGSALDAASLGAALTYFMDIPNDDGMRISMTPRYLVIHPNLMLRAEQLLSSLSPLDAPNENVRSIVAGKLEIVVSPKLTNPNAWFVLAAPGSLEGSAHGLDLWFTPEGMPKTERIELQDPKGVKHIGMFRVAPAIVRVRGAFGNPG